MRICVGIDAAKEVHWATAVTADGRVLLDRKVENTAEAIRAFSAALAALGGERVVGIDMLGGFCSLGTPQSRAFYARKRREGKRHHQAVLALARRRVNVLWAILQTRRAFNPEHRKIA
jgi:hypothetical protein